MLVVDPAGGCSNTETAGENSMRYPVLEDEPQMLAGKELWYCDQGRSVGS